MVHNKFIEQIIHKSSTEGPICNLVKIGQDYTILCILYRIAPLQGQIIIRGQILILTKTFYYFNHTL